MAILPFLELSKVDTSSYHKKKPTFYWDDDKKKSVRVEDQSKWLDYIEWAVVLTLLYEHGAEDVDYGFEHNEKGYPTFVDHEGKNPFVKVWLEIDGKKRFETFPVSGFKKSSTPSSDNIYYSMQRAFVKCAAKFWGLGIDLWKKDEQAIIENPPQNVSKIDNLRSLKDDLIDVWGQLVNHCGGSDKAHDKMGTTVDDMDKLCESGTSFDIKQKIDQMKKLMTNND